MIVNRKARFGTFQTRALNDRNEDGELRNLCSNELSLMGRKILETQTEQEHQEALDESEEREEKVHEAIEKIVTTIEELTDASPKADATDSEFETTLPMSHHESE